MKSTANDRVFIYFSDHGATGLIAFPNGELYADHLVKTLNSMHDKKQYKELVFYLEACESGSMFEKTLPKISKSTLPLLRTRIKAPRLLTAPLMIILEDRALVLASVMSTP